MKSTSIICTYLFILSILIYFPESGISNTAQQFEIARGVNISHWLSQSNRRGEERRAFFTEKDVKYIKSISYDHIRLPVDEEQLWDENGVKETEAFNLLYNAIQWCQKHNLRVIVDLHILRSHHFNKKEKPLWIDPKAQEQFIQLWRDLSTELKHYPLDLTAYELMNEPVADDPEDWNNLVAKAVKAVRELEPERKLVIGSNRWQSASTFDQLRIPEGDRNIILSFHCYIPMLITHYKASWTSVGKYKGSVNYPGQLVQPKEIEKLPDEIALIVKRNNGVYNREALAKHIQKPIEIAKQYGLPLYCGEWGCYAATPENARFNWYKDMRSVLEENGVAWANWDYKGGFGIIDRDGKPIEELISILLPD